MGAYRCQDHTSRQPCIKHSPRKPKQAHRPLCCAVVFLQAPKEARAFIIIIITFSIHLRADHRAVAHWRAIISAPATSYTVARASGKQTCPTDSGWVALEDN